MSVEAVCKKMASFFYHKSDCFFHVYSETFSFLFLKERLKQY